MRRVLPALLAVAVGLPLLLALGVVAVLAWGLPQDQPLVSSSDALSVNDVERALQLARVHDPRRAIPGVVRTLRLTQHEAELLLNHAAARVRPSRWALQLDNGSLRLRGSLRLPDNPLGPWLNLELRARETRGLPQLQQVRLGRLDLPVPLVAWAVDGLAERHGLVGYRALATVAVQRVRLGSGRIDISYAWGPDAPAQLLKAVLSPAERQRLQAYAERLGQHILTLPPRSEAPLAQLMPPLFELARQRSAAGADPALENRAALLVLGMLANGVGLDTLLPERRAALQAHPVRVTLGGRQDFPQHFLVSAALAAENGTSMADLIGLYKELADSRGGSGFSFNDIAANRAGVRLGELAVNAPERLQQRLAAGLQDGDLLPDVSDLPQFLSADEFRRRFGAPGSPAYQRMMDDIEGRLGATPALR